MGMDRMQELPRGVDVGIPSSWGRQVYPAQFDDSPVPFEVVRVVMALMSLLAFTQILADLVPWAEVEAFGYVVVVFQDLRINDILIYSEQLVLAGHDLGELIVPVGVRSFYPRVGPSPNNGRKSYLDVRQRPIRIVHCAAHFAEVGAYGQSERSSRTVEHVQNVACGFCVAQADRFDVSRLPTDAHPV